MRHRESIRRSSDSGINSPRCCRWSVAHASSSLTPSSKSSRKDRDDPVDLEVPNLLADLVVFPQESFKPATEEANAVIPRVRVGAALDVVGTQIYNALTL